MKFYLRHSFLFFLTIFLFVNQAQAQMASEYIEKVEVQLVGGNSTGRLLVPEQFSSNSTIYTEGIESYIDNSEFATGDDERIFYEIGINDSSVSLITKVYFDQAKLKAIGGWNDYDGIWVHRSCSGTALGDQYFPSAGAFYPTTDLETDNFTITFPADPDCKKDLFFQKNKLTLEFKLNKNKGSAFNAKASEYTFKILPKPLANTCQLAIEDAAGNALTSADNNTDLVVVGSNIDDGGLGYHLYLDSILKFNFVVSDDGVDVVDGPPTFTYHLGKLGVLDHQLVIKQDETDISLCSISLPITLVGTTVTPFSEVTNPPDQDGYISSQVIDIATTIPLCDSITNPDLKVKCLACQGSGTVVNGVWTGIGCLPTNFAGIVGSIFTLFSGMMGGLVFICLLSNGIKIMSSRGNPEALKKGQEAITACLVGFVVLALSVFFLKIVGVDILQIPGWN